MSEEVRNQDLKFVDEPGLLNHSLSREIEEYLSNNKVINEEHIIYIRNCNFKGKVFDPHYSPYHAEGPSDLDDINYVYARQIYNVLFNDQLNRFQVGDRERPDLTLICIFEDEFYLLTNWEQFLEVQPSSGGAHVRTLSDYLGWMYEDYVDVGQEEAGIKQILNKVVALSRKEIEPLRSEFKPPMFSLAWFNNPSRLAMVIFGFIVLLLLALGGLVMIRRRKAS
ncbi:MAG: hypothetical protein RIF39_01840 [Cyclobacteriaceae bacterium]